MKAMENNAVWTKEYIRERMATDNYVLYRGILAIYNGQTADEKVSQTTREDNGIGFNGVDAEIMSSFAEQLLKYHRLSEKQLNIARKKMSKYAGQLERIAKCKA